jgi:hypothetical protein
VDFAGCGECLGDDVDSRGTDLRLLSDDHERASKEGHRRDSRFSR